MTVRGIRGATVAKENSVEAILTATQELLDAIQSNNPLLREEDLSSIFFTVTPDLDATYPAYAARSLGWLSVPLLCAQEIPVPGSLQQCIRVLVHWNTDLARDQIKHVYLGEARQLRPDLQFK